MAHMPSPCSKMQRCPLVPVQLLEVGHALRQYGIQLLSIATACRIVQFHGGVYRCRYSERTFDQDARSDIRAICILALLNVGMAELPYSLIGNLQQDK